MKQQMKYKQTEVGMIPENWEVRPIKELGEIKGGKRLPKGDSFSDLKNNYPYIRVTDLTKHTVNTSNLKYLKPETQRRIKNYTITSNDVYISIAGTIGLVGSIPQELNGANLTENAAKICSIKNVDKKFLIYFLNSQIGKSQINTFVGKSTQPKLALFRIEQIKIPIPPITEQQSISEVLSTIDTRLDIIERERQRIERLKEGIMRKLFEEKKWSVVRLGEIIEFKRGFSYRSDQINSKPIGKRRLFTINNFSKEGGLKTDAEKIYILDDTKISEIFVIKKNDVFIANTDMSKGLIIGAPLLMEDDKEALVYSMDLTKLMFDKSKIEPKFLFYFLRLGDIRRKMKMNAQGTNVLHLNHNLIKNQIEIPLPTLEEQKYIAEILNTIDKRLDLQEIIKIKTQKLKKGLMNDLLIGKKRLKEFLKC